MSIRKYAAATNGFNDTRHCASVSPPPTPTKYNLVVQNGNMSLNY